MIKILEVKHLSFSYGETQVFEELSFDVRAGEIVSILGPSGVGKTTLFNLIAGTIPIQEGQISLDGEPICLGKVSYMLQKDLLLEHKTVLGNILLPLQLQNVPKTDAIQRVEEVLSQFKLSEIRDRYPYELSGGMRQRVALLRTYMMGHSLFLLDEAFSALDEMTKADLYQWYLTTQKQLNLTTLLITHSIEEALSLSDRIYILKNRPGRMIAEIPLRWDQQQNLDLQRIEYKRKILDLGKFSK